eukprot:c17140_g1_i3.p1 GENE.c17140_g1_i3~~c17140_g1_i3.p1  ORF type:complete len:328 (+),score=103.68 c17140_g1_i3:19-1002(+)
MSFQITTEKIALFNPSTVKFALIVVGIYFFYGSYGVFKEKLTRRTYDGEKFYLTNTLMFLECVCNAIAALIAMRVTNTALKSKTPQTDFALVSISYFGSAMASNYSLREISYPTQVVTKSCKAVPIMVANLILGRESYSLEKWIAVLSIIAGIIVFTLNTQAEESHQSKLFGLFLVFVSLSLDGVTGTTQSKIKKATDPSAYHYMFFMNFYSCLFLSFSFIASGELYKIGGFITQYPDAFLHLCFYALSSAFGQIFIFLAFKAYGAVRLALITATRKFFTLLVSFVVFGHHFNLPIAFGIGLVGIGIYLEKHSDEKKSVDKKSDKKN